MWLWQSSLPLREPCGGRLLPLFDVARAAEGDVAGIEQRIDVPALRRSFTAQLPRPTRASAASRSTARGCSQGFAASFADPLVERLVTSRVITEVMQRGWSQSLLPAGPAGPVYGLDLDALGNVWQLYLAADYGLGEVRSRCR